MTEHMVPNRNISRFPDRKVSINRATPNMRVVKTPTGKYYIANEKGRIYSKSEKVWLSRDEMTDNPQLWSSVVFDNESDANILINEL